MKGFSCRRTLAPGLHHIVYILHGSLKGRSTSAINDGENDSRTVAEHSLVVILRLLQKIQNLICSSSSGAVNQNLRSSINVHKRTHHLHRLGRLHLLMVLFAHFYGKVLMNYLSH